MIIVKSVLINLIHNVFRNIYLRPIHLEALNEVLNEYLVYGLF